MSAKPDLPPTMRAWAFTSRGDPASILKLTSDIRTPSPASLAPTEVLIRTSHVAMNVGLLVLLRLMPHVTSNPWIPELEFSGTVVEVGSNVSDLKAGDAVFGAQTLPTHFKRGGCLAEYLVMPAELVVSIPANMSMAEASGIAGVGCTAVQAAELAGLKRGDKVFVNGGSGGLGTMMVQVAKAIVGESGLVVATCSGPNVEMVKSIGADEVIDYTSRPVSSYLASNHSSTPFNTIIDTVGTQPLYIHSPSYLTKRGKYINLGGMSVAKDLSVMNFGFFIWEQMRNRLLPAMLGGVPRAYQFYSATPERNSMLKVKELAEAGKVKGVVDGVWSMQDGLKAYERVASQRARGKVVIRVEGV